MESSAAQTDSRQPVTVITGFLGAGKTTLLNQLIRQPEMADSLVIINEFGEIGLDHHLVSELRDETVIELNSGCLCCTVRGDLVRTLKDARWRFARDGKRWFERVIIETTGLADPAPILHTLMTDEHIEAHYRIDGLVTVIDLANGLETLDAHKEALKQAALADCLVLTKADLATAQESRTLLERLHKINPGARRVQAENGAVAARQITDFGLYRADGRPPEAQRWLNAEAYEPAALTGNAASHSQDPNHGDDHHGHGEHHHDHGHAHDVNRHDESIRARCFTIGNPICSERLVWALEMLLHLAGPNLLRVKGILNMKGKDCPVVIHSVQRLFHLPQTLPAWPDEDRRSRIVFITQDFPQHLIDSVMHIIMSDDTDPSELLKAPRE